MQKKIRWMLILFICIIAGIAVGSRFDSKACIIALATVIMISIMSITYIMRDKVYNISKNVFNKIMRIIINHSMIFLISTLLLISIVVFWKYLTMRYVYIFKDIASDSYNQTYPFLYSIIHYIKTKGKIPNFMFTMGLGGEPKNDMIFPYNVILLLFNEETFIYALPYIQIAKIILAGIFFYAYMRERKISKYTSIIMALSYAFCGPMMLRNMWYTYSIEVMLVALILWGFELYYNNKNRFILPLAMLLMLNTLSTYYMVLYTGIIIGYTIFRYFTEFEKAKNNKGYTKRYILKYTICYLIVLLITVLIKYSDIREVLFSTRFNDGISKNSVNSVNYSIIAKIEDLVTAYISNFSLSINIVDGSYKGELNQLNAPTYFGTMITFIFAIMSIHIKPVIMKKEIQKDIKSNKLIYITKYRNTKTYRKDTIAQTVLKIISVILIIIYTASPIFRCFINGMSSESYKLSSLWIIVLMMYWASLEIDRWNKTKRLDRYKLCIVTLTNILLIIIVAVTNRDIINNIELVSIIILLLLLMIFMTANNIHYNIQRATVMGIVIIQVLTGAMNAININGAIETDTLSLRKDYNDYTKECLEYIKSIDDSEFYRIDKIYNSPYLNDSLILDFYGVKSYIGGTDFNSNVREFVKSQGGQFLSYGYMYGFYGITETNTYLGVKYVLAKTDTIPYYGYKLIKQIEDIYIYENEYALPFAFCYDSYITKDEYDAMTLEERREAILENVVVSGDKKWLRHTETADNITGDDENITATGETKTSDKGTTATGETKSSDKSTTTTGEQLINNSGYTVNKNDPDTTLKIELNFTSKDEKQGYLHYVSAGELKSIELVEHKGSNNYAIELNEDNIESFWVNIPSYGEYDRIDGTVKYTYCSKEERYSKYKEDTEKLRDLAVNIESFDDEYIVSSIEVTQDRMLCFTIPYSTKWHIYIDGTEVNVYNVNEAFLGCRVKTGRHTIEVKYIP